MFFLFWCFLYINVIFVIDYCAVIKWSGLYFHVYVDNMGFGVFIIINRRYLFLFSFNFDFKFCAFLTWT